MYSFAQRQDTNVFDEPFYAFYLSQTGKVHPGREDILRSQPNAFEEVFRILNRSTRGVLYIKNMAHQMHLIPLRYFEDYSNIILIRNPAQLIASFAKIIENPDMFDIGIAEQHRMWNHFVNLGQEVIVIDSGELLLDPEKVISEMCDRIKIPFLPEMLTWEAGARPEDGAWARYWYKNVHKSTGFAKQQTSSRPFPAKCKGLLEEAMPLYKELYSHSIKAE